MLTIQFPNLSRRGSSRLLAVALVLAGLTTSAGWLAAGALYLDGLGSYVTFPGTGVPNGNASFTIEAWINPTTIPTGGEDGGQITFWGNQTANQANGFRLRGPSGVRHYFWGNDHDANFTMNILPDTTGLNGDGWHHLALTYNGTQTVWYWNGTVIGTRQTAAGVNVAAVNHRIGARLGAEYFNGFLDEIRIWNRARTGEEIVADMNHSLNGSEPGLVTYFDFEGDLSDRAGGDNNGTALGSAAVNAAVNAPIQTAGPRIYSFVASTNAVMIGNPVTLFWQVTNATTLRIDPNVGAVIGSTNSVQVAPLVTTTYTLTASNDLGFRTAQVTVNVDPGIPIAYPQSVATIKNTPRAITLTASDPNGNTLAFAIVAPPAHGGLTGTPPDVTYTPTTDYFGNDFFTFKVNDGTNDSPAATVSIRIEATPTPPTAIVLSSTNINASAAPGAFLAALRAVDADPLDTHTFALVAGPGSSHNGLFSVSNNVLLAGASYSATVGSNYLIRLRTTDSTALSYEQAFVLRASEVSLNVVINEIHYNGPDNTVLDEFIELHNPKALAVDVSGWRLRGGIDFVIPVGTVIPAGGFLVVAQNPMALQAKFGVTALGPWTGALDSDGEQITLRDAAGQVIDEVDYRSEFPWPIAANGGGGSMELTSPSLDNDLGSSWATPLNPARPSPGQPNQVLLADPAPNIRQVNHTPNQPASSNSVVVTAKVTDPEGVASVVLQYQVVTPGNFIPAKLPLTTAQLNSLNANPGLTNEWNPAFEAASNWVTVAMHDDGFDNDAVAGDDIYSVQLPPQAHRTLVRYRITVTDSFGSARGAPFEDDPALNFAYFVYDGVPDYMGISSAVLTTLPVYTLITRDADLAQCTAWFSTADQLPQGISGARNEGYTHFNWEGAVVYDGVVYDHVTYRLRGANGRYHPGKRSFRIRFNDGSHLVAKDQFGHRYPTKWRELTTAKGQANRGNETFSLNEVVSYYLFNKVDVPAPETFHFHFRVIHSVQETNQYTGDFWGIAMAQEKYDVNFLDAHNLPKGNLYKLVDNFLLGVDERRYQASFAPTNAADFFNIENNLDGFKTTAWLLAHANYTNYYRYHAISEAIRNYDTWPNANKNCAWYFEPLYTVDNSNMGRMMYLPYDMTDTWGPTWNTGYDILFNGIYSVNSPPAPAGAPINTSGGDGGENPALQLEHRNVLRDVRDLFLQPDQINPIIDAFATRIAAVVPADLLRWSNAPAPASYLAMNSPGPGPGLAQGLTGYVQDMKNFMFTGGTYAWWIDRQTIVNGGWVTRLDAMSADTSVPAMPSVQYVGLSGFPINALSFRSSPFSDPQGAGTFAAMQWRLAEVNDTNLPAVDPRVVPPLEWDAIWVSGELTNLSEVVSVPAAVVKPLKPYRTRVRHKDNTGRWSRWSAPFSFYPAPADVISELQRNLAVSEIMYHPPDFGAISGDDLEFLELKNTGTSTLDLSALFFSAGINFTFTNGTSLAGGQTFLLARNAAALAAKYPGIVVNGLYTGRLDNAGETITLTHPQGANILSISYNDRPPWPVTPDGYGFSLVLDEANTGRYRPSALTGGSPGGDDPTPTWQRVVINEVLANSEPPDVDRIELYNPTANDVILDGWFLTDDPGAPGKFRFPDHSVIPAGGYLVLSEAQFNPAPGAPSSFALGSGGDDLYLFAAVTNGELTGYVDGIDFGASETGVTLGRHVTSEGRLHVVRQIVPTFDAVNAGPRVGPLVISEIMYRPPDVGGNDDATNEFIEVVNIGAATVPLFDPAAPTNTWHLKGGVDFVFPTNQFLAAGSYLLLVNFDPTDGATLGAFRIRYGLTPGIPIYGPYSGKLDNSGDDVELQMPILLTPTNTGYVLMEKVDYRDLTPWPKAADGFGASLHRINLGAFGNEPLNWLAAPPTAGAPRITAGTAPVITGQPANQNVSQGQPVSFTVVATGTAPLRYGWMFNARNLPGATNATLVLPAVQPKDIGTYQAVVFNDAGSDLSAPAALSVRLPAIVLQQPRSVMLTGSTNLADYGSTTNGVASFTVQAYSSNPFTYQWRFNGAPIAGANGTSLTISNVNLSHQGTYDVVLTDVAGSIASAPARLDLLLRPNFVALPLSPTTAPIGGSFSVSATIRGGPPPFGFLWRRGSTPVFAQVTDSTNAVFTFGPVTGTDGTTWRVIVTNAAVPTVTGASPNATFSVVTQADFDQDGLPDAWEVANGFSTNNPANASLDVDGDGMTLLQEYIAGTDWINQDSYLRVDEISAQSGAMITFQATAARTYTVQYSDDLTTAFWTKLMDVPASASARIVVVNDPSGSTRRFYRLVTPAMP